VTPWLGRFGRCGRPAQDSCLPPEVFSLPDDQVRLFLRHLWAMDGSVTVSGSAAVHVRYATASERLARDLQLLLLRLDIRTAVRPPDSPRGRPCWTLEVAGADDQRRFLEAVGVPGAGSRQVTLALARLDDTAARTRLGTVPREVRESVRVVMEEHRTAVTNPGPPPGGSGRRGVNARPPGRTRLAHAAAVLADEELELLATSDVFWDEVVSVESLGHQEVYDATVLGTHNFIANGIHVHNSIEQDADMVILLHREDAYEKESPRAGEADLIVAKHRNGPTATITVAFQGHYSRFVDMAQT
jgi:replicative DNA helicase